MPVCPEWEVAGGPAAIVAVARRADELGYRWVPCSDHIIVPKRALPAMGATWYEPATTLAFVAGITQRVRLLSHVIVLPYHNPLAIAKQYATLDRFSGGRVILGVGTGHLRAEFRALHAPFEERAMLRTSTLRSSRRLDAKRRLEGSTSLHALLAAVGSSRTRRSGWRQQPPGGAAASWATAGPFQVTLDEVRDRLDMGARAERRGGRSTWPYLPGRSS
jgi:alkanesulfonate monooxygenase SsuD/methylene tetrahydromethanopterin reductase-like flavin-dependent oxidoreductase (luciferase family)